MDYEPVIGLEIHARLNTATKMFCRCSNDTFNVEPNTHVCPVCMGFPGMLPVLNEACVTKGLQAALALKCSIPPMSKFDRKSYFYPDLPKGFQISQYDLPLATGGNVTVTLADGSPKTIRVNRLHLEDDAGKLTHVSGGTLVDFNRSGSPLMEIVSEADLRSVEEASAYARLVQALVRYANASDADMEKGQMRFDINVSLRPRGQKEFGTKAEVKNLNSFRSLEKALEYEIRRQTERLNRGEAVVQETRGWDDEKEVTVSQRSKEEAADYRYFPEPDLPPLHLSPQLVERLRAAIPEMPDDKMRRYQSDLGLPEADARQLAATAELSAYFERAFAVSGQAKKTANWVLTQLAERLNASGLTAGQSPLSPEHLGQLVVLIEQGVITGNIAKSIFPRLYDEDADPAALVEALGLKVMADMGALETICREVVAANPEVAASIRAGKDKAIGALVGQVMAVTKGSASPPLVNELLRKFIFE